MRKRIPLAWTTVFANNTTQRLHAATPWFQAGNILRVRGTLEIGERTGDNELGLGIDTAQVEDAPDGIPTTIVARQTSAALHFGTSFVDVSSATAGKRLARIVWLCANTATSNLTCVRCAGYVDLELRD